MRRRGGALSIVVVIAAGFACYSDDETSVETGIATPDSRTVESALQEGLSEDSKNSDDLPEIVATNPAVVEFQEILNREAVIFRSWNGRALRVDSDTEIVFFRSGIIGMLEYGYALVSYRGTFTIDPDGKISIQFGKSSGFWPDMALERDGRSLLLRPADGSTGFVMGGRAGAYIPGGEGSYWPFRMLRGEDRKDVLMTLVRTPGWELPSPDVISVFE